MRLRSPIAPVLLSSFALSVPALGQQAEPQGTPATTAPAATSPEGAPQAPSTPPNDRSGEPSSDAPTTDDTPEAESASDVATAPDQASDEEPKEDPYAEAKERVGRGEKLYADGNFDAAVTEFQRAYETMLGHPARPYVLFNIGRCQEKLYRYSDAIASYKQYLNEAGDNAEDRATVAAKVELLDGLLGTLKISVTVEEGAAPSQYEVWVDDRLIGKDVSTFLLPGGNHQVEVRAAGFETQTQQVQLTSRSEQSLKFSLTPLAEEYRGLSSTYFLTVSGLTLGTAAAGGVFGVMALTRSSSLGSKEPAAVTQEDVDGLDGLALTADILFISAGVFAVSATVLGFLTDWSDERPPPKQEAWRVQQVGVLPVTGGAALSLGGSF